MTTRNHSDWVSNWQKLTDEKGAYVLCINLKTTAPAPPKFDACFQPGLYFYAGSAKGSGGIQARCRRHLSKHKRPHWHIDWLTNISETTQALAFPNANECELMNELTKIAAVSVPFRGFGNSDCANCIAHLIICPPGHSTDQKVQEHLDRVFGLSAPAKTISAGMKHM